jgi:hypothetical protein
MVASIFHRRMPPMRKEIREIRVICGFIFHSGCRRGNVLRGRGRTNFLRDD